MPLKAIALLGLIPVLASCATQQPNLTSSQMKNGQFDESNYDLHYGNKLKQPEGEPFFATRHGGRVYFGYYGTGFENGRPYIGSTYYGSAYY